MEGVAPAQVLFIPANPTLGPSMLWASRESRGGYPFTAPGLRYFYFARNAVWLAARLLGLDRGEVLVPAYHHGVEVEALLDAGAQVGFYRVGPRWEVDLEDVERRIGPRTRALYLIHYAGFPGPAAAMKALAQRKGLVLIEDCALSLLSADGPVPLGSFGDASIFCLYKSLPVPNGGALLMNAERPFAWPDPPPPPALSTVSHAASSLLQNLELRAGGLGRILRKGIRGLGAGVVRAGGVERVATGTQHFERRHVDLGVSGLTRRIVASQDLARIVAVRRRNYFFLLARLRAVASPLFNQLAPGVCPLFFPLVVEDKAPVMASLKKRGVESVDFWREFHPACDPSAFPEVASLRRTILEIPCHQDLTPERMAHVAAAVMAALKEQRALRARVKG